MKHLTRTALLAIAAMALVANPINAQSRNGSGSRSSSSQTRSSSSSSSRSSYSSPSRSGSSSSNSRSSYSRSSSYNRSSSPSRSSASPSRSSASPSRSSASPSRSSASPRHSSASPSRSYASPSRSGSSSSSRSSYGRSSSQPHSYAEPSRRTITPPSRNQAVAPYRSSSSRNTNMRNGAAINHDGRHAGPRVAPRDRRPLPPARPAHFYDRGHHYFGHRVSYLPPHYRRYDYWGRPYYLCDGVWYRLYGTTYYVCRPPFGYSFAAALIGDVVYSACRIAYYNDIYRTYNLIDDNARTIAEQNRTIAANNAVIASQNSEMALNSQRAEAAYLTASSLGLVQSYADASTEYFYDDGVFCIRTSDGKYQVIVPPAGALIQKLPDDYDVVTLNGNEYYKVDDTIFEMTVIDGTPYFQVLGQLTGEMAARYDLNK